MAKQQSKTEASEVGIEMEEGPEVEAKALTQEQAAIVQLTASCATVFELVCRSVPSNHIHTIQKEIVALKKILKEYGATE